MVRKSKAADTSVMSPSALAARDSDRTNILDAQRFAKGGPGAGPVQRRPGSFWPAAGRADCV